jgi:hypothetical protein
MKLAIAIITIVLLSAVYVLFSGKYKQDKTGQDKSRIGWGESGESGSDGGSDE